MERSFRPFCGPSIWLHWCRFELSTRSSKSSISVFSLVDRRFGCTAAALPSQSCRAIRTSHLRLLPFGCCQELASIPLRSRLRPLSPWLQATPLMHFGHFSVIYWLFWCGSPFALKQLCPQACIWTGHFRSNGAHHCAEIVPSAESFHPTLRDRSPAWFFVWQRSKPTGMHPLSSCSDSAVPSFFAFPMLFCLSTS